jgi:hypothetical protein
MPEMNIRDMILLIVVVAFSLMILFLVLRIMWKLRKGTKTRKRKDSKVLEAISSSDESDDVFNAIASTRRIASDLKRRGIDITKAEALISQASSYYRDGLENKAKLTIAEAKEMLLNQKMDWDEKTGFDVVPSTPTGEETHQVKQPVDLTGKNKISTNEKIEPDKELPELSKALEKKPDNYLPSKFSISLAGSAVEKARVAGMETGEPQRLLIDAKACFEREDYDEAFRLALCSKREAETLLGGTPQHDASEKSISDLALQSVEPEELKICSICGDRKMPYICIEVKNGEEATCRDCYEKTMKKAIQPKAEVLPPPPPPPPIEKDEDMGVKEKDIGHNYCPNCGARVKNEDVFCGKCGKPVKEELKCVGCGTKVEPGDMFCRKCGARLVT